MISQQRFAALLRDLEQLERTLPRSEGNVRQQGDLILDAFLRHTSHERGAVYLRDLRDASLRLVAKSAELDAAETVVFDVPDAVVHATGQDAARIPFSSAAESQVLIPLRTGRDRYGVVALLRADEVPPEPDETDLLSAVGRYLSAIMNSQRMATEIREGEFQLKYRLWELESLYDIGLSIASTLDLDKLADEILIRTISLLNARRAALYLRRGTRFVLHRSYGDVRSNFLEDELHGEAAGALIEQGKLIRFDSNADCVFPSCESFIALPIRSNDNVIGVLAAADRELREGGVGPFEDNEVRVLSLFASQAAIALENARLHQEALEKQAMQRELELAATIQRDILPRSIPVIDGYEIDALNRPARQLGGDYHTFFEREGTLTLCVADVSGKSVPAAILVSAFHAALQLLFYEGRDLGDIATELNRHMHRWSSENKFITLILATIDPEAEVVRFVNAGHNPGYVMLPSGELDRLHSHGLPIGLMPGTRYKTQMRPFSAGSLLTLYSDGITEAEDAVDEEFGNPRLEEILTAHAGRPCVDVRNAIALAVDEFASGVAQKDDQTMVFVRTAQAPTA